MIELVEFSGSSFLEEFFHLHSLKHLKLKLSTSEMMLLLDYLGRLTNLQHIDLSNCSYLQTLPPSFGNLTKLQHVNLSGCERLKMMPDSFNYLIQLKHLNLIYCGELNLYGETLGNIRTLESLNFNGCHKIEVLPPESHINIPWLGYFWDVEIWKHCQVILEVSTIWNF